MNLQKSSTIDLSGKEQQEVITPAYIYFWLVLLVIIAVPVVGSWLAILGTNSIIENISPAFACVLLSIAIWQRCKQTAPTRVCISLKGLIALGLVSLLNMTFLIFGPIQFYWLSFLGIIFCLAWTLYGKSFIESFLPVLLFCVCLLPGIPEGLRLIASLPLQYTSTLGAAILAYPFIPVRVCGNTLIVKGQLFEVAPACSGLNMWIAFTVIFLIWQLFARFTIKDYLVGFSIIPLITVLLNSVRLFLTVLIAYFYSSGLALSVHSNLEYFLFPCGLFVMWSSVARLHRHECK